MNQAAFSVPGGVVEVADGGGVTGVLKERAVELVTAAMGMKSEEDKEAFIARGLELCSRFGLTSVQTNDECALGVYQRLLASRALPLRVFLTPMHHEISSLTPLKEPLSSVDMASADSMLRLNRVKIFGDGSLGAATAALREPTAAGTASTGVLIHERDSLIEMIQQARCPTLFSFRLWFIY